MVTDAQVRLLRQKIMQGKTQQAAAAAAGMSARSARTWKEGPVPSQSKQSRTWRTRIDPFDETWDRDVVPLLEADEEGKLQATTLLEELRRRYPDRYDERHLRTLQRRLRDWRAVSGPEKEVYFQQEHVAGREAAFDFTHATDLGITVGGAVLVHLLFVLKLSYSGWTWAGLAFRETFEAMVQGLQAALWELGGVPRILRHDNLSAATHELKESGGRAVTQRFRGVLDHYGLESTRIQPGKAHENGVAEKANDLVKSWLEQALLLRGTREFESLAAYEAFVREVIAAKNGRRPARFADERAVLRPLPASALPAYTDVTAKVRRWSTVRVLGRTYSVPSRLIGHEVKARVHPDSVEVYYHDHLVETMPRLRSESDVHIDYRHVIWSLVRKPGAFARYKYREELFPSLVFRHAYDALKTWRGERADVEYVRILHLAASTLEATVQRALVELLAAGEPFEYVTVKAAADPDAAPRTVPHVNIGAPDLVAYDQLLAGAYA
jgi:hypothetical protein